MRPPACLITCLITCLLAAVLPLGGCAHHPAELPNFRPTPHFGERQLEQRLEGGIRLLYNAPARLDPAKPTRLIAYALPNGNSIEQTLGARLQPGMDWHYDIQHIGAQVRRLREVSPQQNIVLVLMEAEGRSWPAWRRARSDANERIARLIDGLSAPLPGPVSIELMAHSGGGSLIFGLMEQGDIPASVERIALLDANYNFEAAQGHGQRLLAWLDRDARHRLIVVAYDDRHIVLDGKPVVSPTGGTWRASQRMLDFLAPLTPMAREEDADWLRLSTKEHRVAFFLHKNPENKILHTRLVGEMNGLLMAATLGRPEAEAWGRFGGPQAYDAWVQPQP
ncbi:hypothetical protein J7U46_07625 [Pelomonas sp. V22]|uniref:hypothetical protein n=1 Tax=Pelomonas sp. V22 TaxID=2822139 RepID=UPI0024A7BBBD|nr:hypothetical protein [Pelomonas sp. V22]MDI4632915.1 hypothetical protein [Pelomonas sp. V22]